ncbi:hypothetical protein F5Y18DRAFT_422897 [Xylariaceae sp. FL1019]|nr:hypothetical protein F5Y18DRAFT_422897 [Xylariaceae sp. FL1019]
MGSNYRPRRTDRDYPNGYHAHFTPHHSSLQTDYYENGIIPRARRSSIRDYADTHPDPQYPIPERQTWNNHLGFPPSLYQPQASFLSPGHTGEHDDPWRNTSTTFSRLRDPRSPLTSEYQYIRGSVSYIPNTKHDSHGRSTHRESTKDHASSSRDKSGGYEKRASSRPHSIERHTHGTETKYYVPNSRDESRRGEKSAPSRSRTPGGDPYRTNTRDTFSSGKNKTSAHGKRAKAPADTTRRDQSKHQPERNHSRRSESTDTPKTREGVESRNTDYFYPQKASDSQTQRQPEPPQRVYQLLGEALKYGPMIDAIITLFKKNGKEKVGNAIAAKFLVPLYKINRVFYDTHELVIEPVEFTEQIQRERMDAVYRILDEFGAWLDDITECMPGRTHCLKIDRLDRTDKKKLMDMIDENYSHIIKRLEEWCDIHKSWIKPYPIC